MKTVPDIPEAAFDEELVSAAQQLARKAINEALYQLTYGPPQTRLSILRSLMPSIGRALAERSEAEDLAEMRQNLKELNQKLLSA